MTAESNRNQHFEKYKNQNWGRLTKKRKLVVDRNINIIYPTFGIEVLYPIVLCITVLG